MYQIYAWKDTGYFSLYSENIDKHIISSNYKQQGRKEDEK